MEARSEASVSWPRALAWRLGRQLLDPVGDESVGGVVRRLGAVPAMDESLAELAVRTRRTAHAPASWPRRWPTVRWSRPSPSGVPCTTSRRRTAGPTSRSARRGGSGSAELGRLLRAHASAWPAFRAAVREALSDGPLTIAELGAAVTRHRDYRHLRAVFDDGAGTLVKPLTWQGDMGFGPPRDGRATFQRLDTNPRWTGHPRPRRGRATRSSPTSAATARRRATTCTTGWATGSAPAASGSTAGSPRCRTGWPPRRRRHDRLRPARGRRGAAGGGALERGAVPARPRPVGHGAGYEGRARHPRVAARRR